MNKMKFLFRFLLATILISGIVACQKPENNKNNGEEGQEGGSETVTNINGTDIDPDNNLVGLISDSKTGKGIAGVAVTDGYNFTTTDENGVYQFEANRYCRKVYYSTPSEYKINLNPDTKLPEFFSTAAINRNKQNRNDFVLEPLDAPEENFTLIMIGDPQCKSDSDVNRFKSETMQDIKTTISNAQASGKYLNAYAITLGDVTFDNTVQWGPMKETMANVKVGENYLPVFNCIGNHDHDAAESNDFNATQNFFEYFGPTDYSFNRGDVHIVVMDDVVCTTTSGSTWSYNAGFSDAQLKWLQQDLNLVKDKAAKTVILCCHIPFRNGSSSGGSNVNKDKGYDEVLNMLKNFKEAHIMIGHTHYPQNYIHTGLNCAGGKPIYEHVHGAACGGWWSCNMNVDGAPNGYSIYEIEGSTVKNWLAKGTNLPEGTQLRVYDGNQIYGSKYTYTWYGGGKGGTANISVSGQAALKGCFVATVWNDDASNWKLELVKDGATYPMRRVTKSLADMCVVSYYFNELGKNTTSWNKALLHYWYVAAPNGNPATETGWEIRATHTVPGSGETNVYTCANLQTDYSGF